MFFPQWNKENTSCTKAICKVYFDWIRSESVIWLRKIQKRKNRYKSEFRLWKKKNLQKIECAHIRYVYACFWVCEWVYCTWSNNHGAVKLEQAYSGLHIQPASQRAQVRKYCTSFSLAAAAAVATAATAVVSYESKIESTHTESKCKLLLLFPWFFLTQKPLSIIKSLVPL